MLVVSFAWHCDVMAQTPGGRGATTTGPKNKNIDKVDPVRPAPPPPAPKPIDLSINVPSGCRVWLNETELPLQSSAKPIRINEQKVMVTYAADSGTLVIKNLKAGPYRVTGRKPDYYDFNETVQLRNGDKHVSSIELTPILGTLTIKPSIDGTDLEVWNLANNTRVGSYKNQLEKIEVTPGRYKINVSKDGYRSAEREVAVKAGDAIYLEPGIERLPPPAPAPTPSRVPRIAKIATTFTVSNDAKLLVFNIRSSSGDFNTKVGTVSIQFGGSAGSNALGSLNGMPCQVEFIKLENIAEGSIVEAPGPSNQWSTVAVRIRPKDQKRPVNFAINWRSIASEFSPSGTAVSSSSVTVLFVPAEPIEKAKPIFPQAAKSTRASGVVTVLVIVDRYGFVTSAKATDGPFVFRQVSEEAARKWKFRPATRNGNPVDSEQSVQFTFQN